MESLKGILLLTGTVGGGLWFGDAVENAPITGASMGFLLWLVIVFNMLGNSLTEAERGD